MVRVRFAPSPTGPLHIGGVRTALFNYLFAKKNGGVFVLRLEDTDQKRFVQGAEGYIRESLEWFGIVPDEGVGYGGDYGPYRQSERLELYREYAKELVNKGWAYYAFDTAEELQNARKESENRGETFIYSCMSRENMVNSLSLPSEEVEKKLSAGEPYVLRFKMPVGEIIRFDDLIRGEVVYNTKELDDKILYKSDGFPTYHLANVVDDYLMKISHVIRGEEWVPSTPLHVLLYQAFGWENDMPKFAHLPLILKPQGQGKLSKRDGDKMGFPVFPLVWEDPITGEESRGYREDGYFPEAVLNMLAFLGWNPGTEQEIFSKEQLIEAFDLRRVGKSGSKFDPEKTKWYNHYYLVRKSDEELTSLFKPILAERSINIDDEDLIGIVSQVKERVSFVHELWEQTNFFFQAPTSYDEKVVKKQWKTDSKDRLEELVSLLIEIEVFASSTIEEKVKTWIKANEYPLGNIMSLFRLCVVGESRGPDLFGIVEEIGKEETVQRIRTAIIFLSK